MRTILYVTTQKSNKSLSKQGLGSLVLSPSYLESGHAFPFSPQDSCSPCEFVHCCHNTWFPWARVRITWHLIFSYSLILISSLSCFSLQQDASVHPFLAPSCKRQFSFGFFLLWQLCLCPLYQSLLSLPAPGQPWWAILVPLPIAATALSIY